MNGMRRSSTTETSHDKGSADRKQKDDSECHKKFQGCKDINKFGMKIISDAEGIKMLWVRGCMEESWRG